MGRYIPSGDSSLRSDEPLTAPEFSELRAEWDRQAKACREIRADVLMRGFEIEQALDEFITESLLPADDIKDARREAFQDAFLKGSGSTLAAKIDRLKVIAQLLPLVAAVCTPELFRDLHAARQIRNDFAHYPIVFQVSDGATKKLSPILCSRRGEVTLNRAFLKETWELLTSLAPRLKDARTQLMDSNR
jgi:hypothetical protein